MGYEDRICVISIGIWNMTLKYFQEIDHERDLIPLNIVMPDIAFWHNAADVTFPLLTPHH